jgi:hypothetical protein
VAKPFGYPKMPDVKPRAPRVVDQPARNGVIGVSQKDRDGTIILHDRNRHVEFIQPRFYPGDIILARGSEMILMVPIAASLVQPVAHSMAG